MLKSQTLQVQEENPDICFINNAIAPLEGSQSVPSSERVYNPSNEFWVCPRKSYQKDMPKKPLEGVFQEASKLDVQSTSTDSFWCRDAAYLLWAPPSDRGPHPIANLSLMLYKLVEARTGLRHAESWYHKLRSSHQHKINWLLYIKTRLSFLL